MTKFHLLIIKTTQDKRWEGSTDRKGLLLQALCAQVGITEKKYQFTAKMAKYVPLKTHTDTQEQTQTYLPPERHTKEGRHRGAQEKHPPVFEEESQQWQQHVARTKEQTDTHGGENCPHVWAQNLRSLGQEEKKNTRTILHSLLQYHELFCSE